jgi:hypothetical protein
MAEYVQLLLEPAKAAFDSLGAHVHPLRGVGPGGDCPGLVKTTDFRNVGRGTSRTRRCDPITALVRIRRKQCASVEASKLYEIQSLQTYLRTSKRILTGRHRARYRRR